MNDLAFLQGELEKIKNAVGEDFTPVIREFDEWYNAQLMANFAARQTPDGAPWAGDATEIKTGAMLEQLRESNISNNTLRKGTILDYAPYQQYGVLKAGKRRKKRKQGPPRPGTKAYANLLKPLKRSRRRRRKARPMEDYRQPPRPVIGLTDQHADKAAEMMAEFAVERIMRAI